MKEATGELNMTVVIVIAIAALSAFFYTILWPIIKNNVNSTTQCNNAICDKIPDGNGMVTCYTVSDGKKTTEGFQCVWKG
jgi:hypothetical protein